MQQKFAMIMMIMKKMKTMGVPSLIKTVKFLRVEKEDYENICQLNPPLNERQGLIHLRNVQSELNQPVSEKELWHFFGANCYTDIDKKKKPKVFVDILLHRYLADVDGPTVTIKIKISPW